ncbi:MAG: cytochrome c biogenesis protein CcsA [Planctomycetota bacterium]
MTDAATSIPLILMTALSAGASLIAIRPLRPETQSKAGSGSSAIQHLFVGAVALGSITVLIVRWLGLRQSWSPVESHVDGLLLMCALFAGAVLFIQRRPKLRGLAAFALPLLTLMLLWAVCASLWTYRPFNLASIASAWLVFHTVSTYIGLLSCAIGAIGGAMYLYMQRRLKTKQALPGRLASLETLETLIIRTATLGFVLLTLSLLSGVILITRNDTPDATPLGADWWLSPKVILATLAWAVYALLMNVRHATAFRGRRAAWLAIAGLVLVIATYGVVEAIEKREAAADSTAVRVFNSRCLDRAPGCHTTARRAAVCERTWTAVALAHSKPAYGPVVWHPKWSPPSTGRAGKGVTSCAS